MTITNHPTPEIRTRAANHPPLPQVITPKSPQSICVIQPHQWQPAVNQTAHHLARKPCPMATAEHAVPVSSINTSPSPFRATHDSGPLWLATPLTYDTFIYYNLPVYPGT